MNKEIETVMQTEIQFAFEIFEKEIVRLYKFGHTAQADAMFETTLRAFKLNRTTFNATIKSQLS